MHSSYSSPAINTRAENRLLKRNLRARMELFDARGTGPGIIKMDRGYIRHGRAGLCARHGPEAQTNMSERSAGATVCPSAMIS